MIREWKYFSENVRKSIEELLLEEIYDKTSISINVIVIQNNGSIQSTIINTISLAILDAGIMVKDLVISMSAGYLQQFQKTPVLDLNFIEEKKSQGVLVIGYLPQMKKVIYVESKKIKMQIEDLNRLLLAC